MSEKTREKPLSKRERTFCQLRYEDKLNDEDIAAEVGIAPSTVYEWLKKPRIIAEIERLGKADTEKAIRFFQRNSLRAAQATVKLTETKPLRDEKGEVVRDAKGREIQDFIHPAEVVRKASADILQALKIDVKGSGELGQGTSGVVVYLPQNNRKKAESENT